MNEKDVCLLDAAAVVLTTSTYERGPLFFVFHYPDQRRGRIKWHFRLLRGGIEFLR